MLNVAVIGTGHMGRNHVRVYSELPLCNLVAIADVDEKKGAILANQYKCNYYSDYSKMLDREKIDAVSIVVPTSQHKMVALDVIKRGIHILLEKPIAETVEDAQEIVRAAENARIKLLIGHIERFNPAVTRLIKILRQGRLGDITSIVATRVGILLEQKMDDNVIIDLAVHDIDIINYILGKQPLQVYATGGKALVSKKEDYAEIFMKYDGVSGFIVVNWITPIRIRKLNLIGTKGYVELNYITQELTIYEHNYEKNYDNTLGDFVVKYDKSDKIDVGIDIKEPLKEEILHFLQCIEHNQQPICTGMDAMNALKIALEAQKQIK